MGWIIVLVSALVIGIAILLTSSKKIHNMLICIWVMLLLSLFICGMIFDLTQEFVSQAHYSIVALQDNRGIQGSGSRFYVKLNSTQEITMALGNTSSYVIWNIPASRCRIFEGKYEQPYVDVMQLETLADYPKLKKWFGFKSDTYWYNIYIPEGTLKTEYNIDLS